MSTVIKRIYDDDDDDDDVKTTYLLTYDADDVNE